MLPPSKASAVGSAAGLISGTPLLLIAHNAPVVVAITTNRNIALFTFPPYGVQRIEVLPSAILIPVSKFMKIKDVQSCENYAVG
jgi:hypothetical protein